MVGRSTNRHSDITTDFETPVFLRCYARSGAASADVSLGPEPCCWNGDGCIGRQGLLGVKCYQPNVGTTREVLLPVIKRLQGRGYTLVVRADAAFAIPALYEALEQRGVAYAIRLPANDVLERAIADLLTRPRGRPSYAPLVRYRSFQYQAASWDRPRRVIAKVEHHLGELFPRVGFIVTTLTGPNRAVVRFYNQRGTAEQWIKERKEATHWTRLSCHRFRANEVRLLLGVIAYNLGNLLRRLALPRAIQSWSLTSLQLRLFKTGGRLIRHARYFVLQLAESYLTQRLFGQILGRIERLAWHPT
jgi:Transposase DDE domain group 1